MINIFLVLMNKLDYCKIENSKYQTKCFFQWYLTKYNYQALINGYNDFFLIDGLRPWNVYKKDAYSSDLIRLFEFDINIFRIIFNDMQNIELFLQNSVIQAFAKTFEK